MNKLFKIVSVALLAGSFVLPIYGSAQAQQPYGTNMAKHKEFEQVRPDRPRREGALKNQDEFLDSHQNIDNDLRKDPRLIDNKDYVRNHPELQTYLHDHPNIRHEWREHPRNEMHRDETWQRKHPNE